MQSDFDVSTAAESAALIAFSRGLDVDDLDGDGETNEAREWVFGDALHSRPLPLNYGSIGGYSDPDNPAIYIAVGSDDGMLRMIRNTRPLAAGDSGEEIWAFMPRAHRWRHKRLCAPTEPEWNIPYTMDGAPVAFILDVNHDGSIICE